MKSSFFVSREGLKSLEFLVRIFKVLRALEEFARTPLCHPQKNLSALPDFLEPAGHLKRLFLFVEPEKVLKGYSIGIKSYTVLKKSYHTF